MAASTRLPKGMSGNAGMDAGDAQMQNKAAPGSDRWIGLVTATGSPLKLFALIVLICNSVFGVTAAWSYGEDIFI